MPRSSRPRWHLIYYVLAGFDLLTISISLYLNHRLGGIYVESVRVNQEWAERLRRYSELGELANRVNATANDVFETRDVAEESARMRESLRLFGERLAAARDDLALNVPGGQSAKLIEHVEEVAAAMAAQVAEGERVFAFLQAGQLNEAGERMARTDRQHARLNSALSRLRAEVAAIQATHFVRQTEVAASVKASEYVIAGAIVLMVGGVTFYGYKLAQQVARATQATEQQAKVIAQIATGVAHELRNPLTSIMMLVQNNRELARSRGMPAEDLELIEQEIRRMDRCLRTFVDFARPARPARRPIDLAPLVQRTFALIEGRAARQRVALRADSPSGPIMVEADWEQIQQLLLNLALNALDAMPQGGKMDVVVHPAQNGYVEMHVRDSGPGIAPHVLPRLFEPFVTSKETGVGLGLVVSRRIAQDHGGTLTAENRPEGGACFVLRLPTAGPAAPDS